MKHVDVGAATRRGIFVLVALAVVSLAEYWLAVTVQTGIMVPLSIVMVLKTGLIAWYFMHIGQLWHGEEE